MPNTPDSTRKPAKLSPMLPRPNAGSDANSTTDNTGQNILRRFNLLPTIASIPLKPRKLDPINGAETGNHNGQAVNIEAEQAKPSVEVQRTDKDSIPDQTLDSPTFVEDQVAQNSTPNDDSNNLPTYQEAEEAEKTVIPEEMGVNEEIYPKVVKAAKETKSLIFIRKTSKGSVMPFANRTAVGKKLPTKGKSSKAYFTKGNIPFFASLSKKVVNWAYEQHTLIGVTADEKSNQPGTKRYAYIPKLIAEDDKRIKENGELLPGIIKIENDLMMVVEDDDFGGISTKATYYLRLTTFNEVNKDYGDLIAPPSFVKNDNQVTNCYEVFIARKSIYTQAVFNEIKEKISKAIKETVNIPTWAREHGITEATLNSLSYRSKQSVKEPIDLESLARLNGDYQSYMWEHYWYVQEKIDNKSPLEEFAKSRQLLNATFYPVKVLALLTKGQPKEDKKSTSSTDTPETSTAGIGIPEKKLYEVVADYDVFMIAPHIDELKNTLINRTGDFSLNIEEFKKRFIPQADTSRPQYGIASDFEKKEVRRAINRAMGINAVQHGTEIANVFHISDIEEPVMMFAPGATDISKDLFFLNLDLLFKLFAPDGGSQTLSNYKPGKITGDVFDPNYNVNISIPAGHELLKYVFLFNLNWGTNYYIEKTMPSDKKSEDVKKIYIEAQTAKFKTLVYEKWNKVFPGTATTTQTDELSVNALSDSFKEIFPNVQPVSLPPPVSIFMLFLFQNWRLVSVVGNLSVEVKENFAVKLLFWGYYYLAIYQECKTFAPLVHIEEDVIDEVRNNYKSALVAIKNVVQKVIDDYFPEARDGQLTTPEQQESTSTGAANAAESPEQEVTQADAANAAVKGNTRRRWAEVKQLAGQINRKHEFRRKLQDLVDALSKLQEKNSDKKSTGTSDAQ